MSPPLTLLQLWDTDGWDDDLEARLIKIMMDVIKVEPELS
jgi:hypothetical protein